MAAFLLCAILSYLEPHTQEILIVGQWNSGYGDAARIRKLFQAAYSLTSEYDREVTLMWENTGKCPRWYRAWTLDYAKTRDAWNRIDDVVGSKWMPFKLRMDSMKQIRLLIGDDMYLSGTLPPLFPSGYPPLLRMPDP